MIEAQIIKSTGRYTEENGPFLYERHHTTFVDYLRICFRSAGLPPLEAAQENKDVAEILAYLRQDLLPI